MKSLLHHGCNSFIGLLMVMAVLLPAPVCAQSRYFIEPSIVVSEIYDDNIFFSLSEEESAYITRVSPGLVLGHESQRLTWNGNYRVDAEDYRGHSELNSNDSRRLADMTIDFLASSRLTLSADADYTKTKNPVDISLVPGSEVPGLLVGRVTAERTSLHPSAQYRFTKLVTGSLSYRDTRDKLSGGVENDTFNTDGEIDRKLSPVTTARLGYTYREYQFDNAPGQAASRTVREYSHRPWLGISHEISSSLGLDARAGSRRSGGSSDPYLLFALRGQYNGGQFSVQYENNETTSLGDASKHEYQTVYASISRRFGQNLNVELSPGYTKLKRDGASPEIYRFGLQGWYRITDTMYLTASYDLNYQKIDFSSGSDDEVKRNVIQLGIRFIYPRKFGAKDPS